MVNSPIAADEGKDLHAQLADPNLPPSDQAAVLKALLRDPNWRLRNLYRITDKDARETLFTPWPEQEKFVANLWFRNLILKARQRGFSTVIQLLELDTCLFNANTQAAVIAQDKEASGTIFRNKIKFAYDKLPVAIRRMNPLTKNSESELILANGSSLKVATSVRSGTYQWLHVSEFGKICAKYPEKAREIVSGSLPSVDRNGIACIESTAEGREGHFYDMTERAIAALEASKKLSHLDYRFHFASWHDADEYELDPEGVIVTPADNAYFGRLEAELGLDITPRKRAWYVNQRDVTFSGDRELMLREYPSTPKEAFEQSTEGCYLAEQLALARRQGRITTLPYDPSLPVNTFWDLHHGGGDAVAIWFHQRVALRDHFIRYIEGSGEVYAYYVRLMQSFGYTWGKHYLPHDGDRRFPGAETNPTARDLLEGLGLRNFEIVDRTPALTAGIQQLRNDFVHYWFDETNCAEGLKRLGNYKKQWNERMGCWSDSPREDGNQHAADGLRQKAQGYSAPSSITSSSRRKQRNRSGMAI